MSLFFNELTTIDRSAKLALRVCKFHTKHSRAAKNYLKI